MTKLYQAADLFCGAGGTTTGAEASGFVKVRLAVNHWRPAVYSHQQNHPHVRHVCAEIDQINPRDFEGIGIDLLIASPECVFHSIARGGGPVDDQRRASAWCVQRWAEVLRPKWIVVENVREFADWAPLGVDDRPLKSKKGEIFQAWVNALRALNYHVEWRLLNAADFGGATRRVRLFIVARRGQSAQPIPWPAPTHGKENWTPAAAIIDWSRPCPSIFSRKRPLVEKTLNRIEIGIRKFCQPYAEPFIVKLRNNGHAKSPGEPLDTLTTARNYGLAMPFVVQYHGGEASKSERAYSLFDPLPVVDTQPRYALAAPYGGARGVDSPLSTVTTKHRHGLTLVKLMQELGIVDIGFRMLDADELAAAQGFPPGYHLFGTKAEQIKQIGNSVHTLVAKAICTAIGGAA